MTSTPLEKGDRAESSACAAVTPATCSQKREQRGMPIEMLRMMGLDTAAKLLGKSRLADELCITVRALNFKLNAERGVSDEDVLSAAQALEEEAERFLAHARKLRAALPLRHVEPDTPAALAMAVRPWCDHVERFAYERQGTGLDASPHMLAAAARRLAAAILPILPESTKTADFTPPQAAAPSAGVTR